jgi:tetratricopeptide (TPR) repeat protein
VDLFYKSYFASPPDVITPRFKGLVYFESGFACMECNDYDGGYAHYSMVRQEFKETYGNNVYHTGHYIMSCLLSGHYDEAVKAFEETYKPRIDQKIHRSMLFDIYSLTCLIFLYKGDHAEAFKYIKEMQTYRSNEITRFGQGILRVMESLYYLVTGEYDTAAVLTKRNLKFLKAENAKSAISPFHMKMMEAMHKIIKAKDSPRSQKQELLKSIDVLQKGVLTIYTRLLVQVVERDF